MSKQRTYYCPVCDGELWPTPCEKWYACPKGCTKLLPRETCDNRTRAEREADDEHLREVRAKYEIEMQQEAERLAKLDAIIPDLPFAGIDTYFAARRSFDIWWVMGMEGKFQLMKRGIVEGCVHAYDPTYKTYRPERALRIVSLKRLSKRQLLYRADLLVKESQ